MRSLKEDDRLKPKPEFETFFDFQKVADTPLNGDVVVKIYFQKGEELYSVEMDRLICLADVPAGELQFSNLDLTRPMSSLIDNLEKQADKHGVVEIVVKEERVPDFSDGEIEVYAKIGPWEATTRMPIKPLEACLMKA